MGELSLTVGGDGRGHRACAEACDQPGRVGGVVQAAACGLLRPLDHMGGVGGGVDSQHLEQAAMAGTKLHTPSRGIESPRAAREPTS